MKTCVHSLLTLFVICIVTPPAFSQEDKSGPAHQIFWQALEQLYGKAFEGQVIAAPDNDTVFTGKRIVMHVRACERERIRIPLVVGEDRSRTWVLTRTDSGLTLRHDHRHADGSEDEITQYGGIASSTGLPTVQMFPADQFTAELLPPAASNVWWIEMLPGVSFTYNLRRLGTERFFSVRFDLTTEVVAPEAPWGWKD